MKCFFYSLLFIVLFNTPQFVFAQEAEDPSVHVVNEVQFDLKSIKTGGDTLVVDLFAISYEKDPREFRLNVFGTNLTDSDGVEHLFTSVQVGRVIVNISERQNYLNYLLNQDVPVAIQLKLTPTTDAIKKAKQVKLVFAAFEEEGKFVEARLNLGK
ncbi:hypothetical protein GQF61_16535 [Sphingobacterium sp. DK4209]|uniref:DUF4625 domain-containing protein n=1 Tax=Sphingobacterium zhuxiongii TaxID=2662364 RepID=A0A5Q0QBQ3_9SPHI|nr:MULTISPECIES: hypothetical protein [unclassified Sphingobacterium]MVZ67462.1 hypothetical protein [Sphingobacterium sp. DK4209]QGA25022.1 hypothetical protein GFH32_01195 [Sphingobacterium sp. dk4302]